MADISLEKLIDTPYDALTLIIDLGFDHDGWDTAENLEALIDEMVEIARIGLKR